MVSALDVTADKSLQTDLIALGYLPKGGDDGKFGPTSKRALVRFQRHAARVYRKVGCNRCVNSRPSSSLADRDRNFSASSPSAVVRVNG